MKRDFTIFIPTRSRAHIQKTFNALPKQYHKRTFLVVDHNQEQDYRNAGYENLLVCPADVQGIYAVRKYILEQSPTEKVFMLDDDLKFVVRKSDKDTKLRPSSDQDIIEMMDYVSMALNRYVHVGVSARQGNNHITAYERENTRFIRFLCYKRTPVLKEVEFCRTDVMEDFDMSLQLLCKGYKSLVVFHWAQDQTQTQAKGGCSDWRTKELHEKSVMKMKELHGDLVKVREKKNKTGGDFGNRMELTIYWMKAYASSQKY